MNSLVRLAAALAAALLIAQPALAQQEKPYQPLVGQPGKDVIWVPTPDEVVDRMLTMAQVTKDDLVYDLGAGNGKIAIAAAKKFGARAIGVEYNPDMARHAQGNVEAAGVADRAKIVQGDIFATNFSEATVVTMYLLPVLNLKLRPTILAMRPGTRVVSHSFTMEDWEPDEVSVLDTRRVYFWVVAPHRAGGWQVESGAERHELNLEQRYQKIEGSMTLAPTVLAGLRDPRVRGFHIRFSLVGADGVERTYTGSVANGRMEGGWRADNGTEGRWTAIKR
jgi:SAM-dependent methyltransferase